jgi:hypothetical protein
LISQGFNEIGYSFDGDSNYNVLFMIFENCFQNIIKINFNVPLQFSFVENFEVLIFSDLLHLVKCDRYRRSKDVVASSHIFDDLGEISPDSFLSFGIP